MVSLPEFRILMLPWGARGVGSFPFALAELFSGSWLLSRLMDCRQF